MKNNASIGIFDSGFGGLTVMRAVKAALPNENIIYFGDTARLPYGCKSAETILRYTIENMSFLIDQGIKILVIACHTACSHAPISEVQKLFSVPILGMIEATVDQTLQVSKSGSIAILGTKATISSGVYQREIQNRLSQVEISTISCPLFVPLIEEGYIGHALTEMVVQEYLRPLRYKQIDTVVLGCTHYPLLKEIIQKEVGDHVFLLDPAIGCAIKIKEILHQHDMINHQTETPRYQFYVSDDPEKFRQLGKTFLSDPIDNISRVRT